VLREDGPLLGRREGNWVYYTADEDAVEAAAEFLRQLEASMRRPHAADHCDERDAG